MNLLICDECREPVTEEVSCAVDEFCVVVLCGSRVCSYDHRDIHGEGRQYAADVR